jgi:hypothetical protein
MVAARSLVRLSFFVFLIFSPGCVERTLTIRSDPPGALLTVNGVEVGRTPYTHDFIWYGDYDIVLRKDGYETVKAVGPVNAPWWQWIPIDLVVEVLPFRFHDDQRLSFSMLAVPEVGTDPHALISRAEEMRPMLQSSEHTRVPTTLPTQPTTRNVKKRATTTQSSSGQ